MSALRARPYRPEPGPRHRFVPQRDLRVTVPVLYAYQWNRNGKTAIPGATSATYTLVDADLGATLTCIVTGINPAGSTPTATEPTPAVLGSGAYSVDYLGHY